MLAEGHLSPARVQSFDEQGLSSWEGSQPPADGTEPVPKVLTGASGTKMLLFILNVAAFRGLPRTPPPQFNSDDRPARCAEMGTGRASVAWP